MSGLGGNRENHALKLVLPFNLTGKPGVGLDFTALSFECRKFEVGLRLQLAKPGFLDKNVACGALAAATAKRFNRQSGLPKYFHQGGAIAGIDFVLRAIAVGCENPGQYLDCLADSGSCGIRGAGCLAIDFAIRIIV